MGILSVLINSCILMNRDDFVFIYALSVVMNYPTFQTDYINIHKVEY